ncbi:hypothetical protein M0E84_04035 [Corynebacterium sp. CCM 9186]|uniref:hypothetical protein n=1 Tax=Corynebacterium meridianum TaxID=2765363 RepID=UPI0020069F2D|nr:hypothetical protein [Corynebacterium meridianum]MCK7677208.1 hypothetical protein [Corynebacterium meridianum]
MSISRSYDAWLAETGTLLGVEFEGDRNPGGESTVGEGCAGSFLPVPGAGAGPARVLDDDCVAPSGGQVPRGVDGARDVVPGILNEGRDASGAVRKDWGGHPFAGVVNPVPGAKQFFPLNYGFCRRRPRFAKVKHGHARKR